MLRIANALHACLLAELRRLVLWLPVGMALGSAGYFALPYEPDFIGGALLPLLLSLCAAGAAWLGLRWRGVPHTGSPPCQNYPAAQQI